MVVRAYYFSIIRNGLWFQKKIVKNPNSDFRPLLFFFRRPKLTSRSRMCGTNSCVKKAGARGSNNDQVICLSVCLFVGRSVHLSFCPSVHLSIHLSIWLSVLAGSASGLAKPQASLAQPQAWPGLASGLPHLLSFSYSSYIAMATKILNNSILNEKSLMLNIFTKD